MFPSHRTLVAGRGQRVEVRMQAGLHLDARGSNPNTSSLVGMSCHPRRTLFLQRMLTELQTPNLVVAGSNPAGRKTVAQWLEHAVSSILVAAFCFEVNAGGFTGKSVMVLAMKVPGPSPGLFRQIAQFTTRRSSSPLFCFGHAGTEGSATAKNVVVSAVRVAPDAAGKSVDEQG